MDDLLKQIEMVGYRYTINPQGTGYGVQYIGGDRLTMTIAPEIESSIHTIPVIDMSGTFKNCEALLTSPILPDKLENMFETYCNCKNIKIPPEIPKTVKNMEATFAGCMAIESPPHLIHCTIENMKGTFIDCKALKTSPSELPETVVNMLQTFKGCEQLEIAPIIGSQVTNMKETFCDCILLKAPSQCIPKEVTNIEGLFKNCTSLNGEITILSNSFHFKEALHKAVSGMNKLKIYYIDSNKDMITSMIQESTYSANIDKRLRHKKIETIKIGGYTYCLNTLGYNVVYTGDDKESLKEAPPIEVLIEGLPVYSMIETFKDCKSLESSPEIPYTVINLSSTFENCCRLEKTPFVPDSVIHMNSTFMNSGIKEIINIPRKIKVLQDTFRGCGELVIAPDFPDSVKTLKNTFRDCIKLERTPRFGNMLEIMEYAFNGCVNLEMVTNLPEGITSLEGAFWSCYKIENMPNIPDSVTNMYATFANCLNLKLAPKLPKSLINMSFTFFNCKKIIEAPLIPSDVNNMYGTFKLCTNLESIPIIPESITNFGEAILNAGEVKAKCTVVILTRELASITYLFGEKIDAEFEIYTIEKAPDTISKEFYKKYPKCILKEIIKESDEIDGYKYFLNNQCNGYAVKCTNQKTISMLPFKNMFCGLPVNDMSSAYKNLENLKKIEFGEDTLRNITTMDEAFSGCRMLVDIRGFAIPSKVTTITGLCSGCWSLNQTFQIPFGIQSMDRAFENCNRLTFEKSNPYEIPYSVTSMKGTFSNAGKLSGVINMKANLSYNSEHLFRNCDISELIINYTEQNSYRLHSELRNAEFHGDLGEQLLGYEYTLLDGGKGYSVRYYGNNQKDLADRDKMKIEDSIDGVPIVDMFQTFLNCTNLTVSPRIPSGVLTLEEAFKGCINLVEAPVINNSVINMKRAFYGCYNMEFPPDVLPDSVVNLQETFRACIRLKEAPILGSNVKNLFGTFHQCESLKISPQLPKHIITMEDTFIGCRNLLAPPKVIPKEVKNMARAFWGCEQLVSSPFIESQVVDSMHQTFKDCTALKIAPFIPSNVKNMEELFCGCKSLLVPPPILSMNEIDVVTDMFKGCNLLYGQILLVGEKDNVKDLLVDISNNKKKLIVNYCQNMESKIKDIIGDNKFVKVGRLMNLIERKGDYIYTLNNQGTGYAVVYTGNKRELVKAPRIEDFIHGIPVDDMTQTFAECYNLCTIGEIGCNVKKMKETFIGCYSLQGAIQIRSHIDDYRGIFHQAVKGNCKLELDFMMSNKVRIHNLIFETNNSNISMGNPLDGKEVILGNYTYLLNEKGTAYAVEYTGRDKDTIEKPPMIKTELNGIPIDDMTGTFYNCTKLKVVPNFPKTITNMDSTFYNCRSLTFVEELPPNVSILDNTFYNCTSLQAVQNFPKKIISMEQTFYNCKAMFKMPKIPIGVLSMKRAFVKCLKLQFLENIPPSIVNMTEAFENCESLQGTMIINTNTNRSSNIFSGAVNRKNTLMLDYTKNNKTMIESMLIQANNPNIKLGKETKGKPVVHLNGYTYTLLSREIGYAVVYTGIDKKTMTKAPIMEAFIDSYPVVDMSFAFCDCTLLAESPIIPQNIEIMVKTYKNCLSLSISPEIPVTVKNMTGVFSGCIKLETIKEVPINVKYLSNAFENCINLSGSIVIKADATHFQNLFINGVTKNQLMIHYSCINKFMIAAIILENKNSNITLGSSIDSDVVVLDGYTYTINYEKNGYHVLYSDENRIAVTTVPSIQNSINNKPVIDMTETFMGCGKLEQASNIPDGVVNMNRTYSGCKSLVEINKLPDGITSMYETFCGCESMEQVPIIPTNVEIMIGTFKDCKNLRKAPELPHNVTDLIRLFSGCSKLIKAPIIKSSVTVMIGTFENCFSLNGEIVMRANLKTYYDIFKGAVTGTNQLMIHYTMENRLIVEEIIEESNGIIIGKKEGES